MSGLVPERAAGLARAVGGWIVARYPDPLLGVAGELLLLAELDGHTSLDLAEPPANLAERVAGIDRQALSAALRRYDPPLVLDGTVLYTRLRWQEEGALAAAWAARLGPAADPAAAPGTLESILDRGRVAVLTGPAGSGKTTLVHALLHALWARDPELRIALAAPTGKAAARLAESLSAQNAARPLPRSIPPPTTLHRLLGLDPYRGGPRYDAWRPLPADLVIVDEASMLGQRLTLQLLEALEPSARLLLVGDAEQLPAIEAGHVLAELARPDASPGAVLRLTQRHRQAGALAHLAEAVKSGDLEAALAAVDGQSVRWRPIADAGGLDRALAEYGRDLRAALSGTDPGALLVAQRDHRLLTALADGPYGAGGINRRLAAHWPEAVARPLIVLRNDPELELWNGDTGILYRGRAWFELPTGRRSFDPALLPAHDAAYALTVHKAQGSEYAHVIVLLPPAPHPLLSREWLYTAVTRARSTLELWADRATLAATLARRHGRHSRLAERIARLRRTAVAD